METERCFLCEDAQGIGTLGSLGVSYNKFSLGVGHSLFAPAEHREELQQEDLASVIAFVRDDAGIVFHNMRGAGASKPDHLHFQALLHDGAFPIEVGSRSVLVEAEGVTVSRVDQYPAYALALRGPRRAQVAFTFLGALRPTPFNLLITREEVFVVPRTKERPSSFGNAFGALEMSGCVVLTSEDKYPEVTYGEIWDAIAESGWPAEAGRVFERRLALDLMLMEEAVASAAAPLPALSLG